MSIIGFMPLRAGSKGIKNKNIYPILGKPLAYWVLSAIEKSTEINQVVVAIDSLELENVIKSFGFSKVMLYRRKDENARDDSPTIDVVLEYLSSEECVTGCDAFCLFQATSPLLTSDEIDKFVQTYYNSSEDSSFSGVELKRVCWTQNGEPILHDIKHRKRREDLDKIVIENGAMYINSIENILENKSLLSGRIKPYIMPEETITEIDEYGDIGVVEHILKKRIKPDINDFKMFLTDCDGVLTDGGMYYSESGESFKKFNTLDGMGISLIKNLGLKAGIVTSENTNFAKARAEKLNIECYLNVKDKYGFVKNLASQFGVSLKQIIYIGDDINDLELLKSVGFSACPANAQRIIKNNVSYISNFNGGSGALRDIINFLLD